MRTLAPLEIAVGYVLERGEPTPLVDHERAGVRQGVPAAGTAQTPDGGVS